jgi:hypothetical protein
MIFAKDKCPDAAGGGGGGLGGLGGGGFGGLEGSMCQLLPVMAAAAANLIPGVLR